MSKVFIGLVSLFALVGILLIWQASSSKTSPIYTPSELLSKVDADEQKSLYRVRVVGRVEEEGLSYHDTPPFQLQFKLADSPLGTQMVSEVTDTPQREEEELGPEAMQKTTLAVVYDDIKPDMFAPGRDVIVDGDFVNGELRAASLLTQCPSKYTPASPTDAGEE